VLRAAPQQQDKNFMIIFQRSRFLTLSLLWLASLVGSAAAWAAGDVVSELMVWSVAQRDGGTEALLPVRTVKPGELLQYTAVYTNQGKAPVTRVVATLPVPAGMELAAVPAATLASLDGKSYAPAPLMRKVRGADGKEAEVAVPLSEYRSLRWPEQQIAAGAKYSVSARMQVVSTTLAQTR
jgi:uncharacterized repeat protein (TIGR01451 family)